MLKNGFKLGFPYCNLKYPLFNFLGDSNNNANRRNTDSTSHTDGASTPEVVSHSLFNLNLKLFLQINK